MENLMLKEFYYSRIHIDGMPAFEELSNDELNRLRNTFSFAIYKFVNAFEGLFSSIKRRLNLS